MYVVVARYYTLAGAADDVLGHLREMLPLSRSEPGCRTYTVNQSVDDPRRIILYEEYDDEAAFQDHASQAYFADIVRAKIWPLLESRERDILHSIDPSPMS